MQCIIGLILLVASTHAIDYSNLKQRTLNRQVIDTKNTETEWDNLKINPKFKAILDKDELKSKPEWPRNQTRIAGGEPADYGQFPWQAAIMLDDRIHCGAVLISDEWVFTTAACVFGLDEFVVVIGAIHLSGIEDIDKKEISVNSGNVIMHPGFNNHDFHHNAALIRLPYRVELNNNVFPPPLPNTCVANPPIGYGVVITGWGSVSGDAADRSSVLMWTILETGTKDDCAEYGDYMTDNDLCLITYPGYTPCYGDIGAPVIFYTTDITFLVGVVSVLPTEGCLAGRPVVLSYFGSDEYLQWIQDNTGLPLVC